MPPESKELTLIVIKPESIKQRLVGAILERFEAAGLTIVSIRSITVAAELAGRHYSPELGLRRGEELRARAIEHLAGKRVVVVVLEGRHAVEIARNTVGHNVDPTECSPGTIRHDLGTDSVEKAVRERRSVRNLVHASDSPSAAREEIALWTDPFEKGSTPERE